MIRIQDTSVPPTEKTGATFIIGSGLSLSETSDGLPILQSAGGGPSGTVNNGLINQLAWYAASGNSVSGLSTAANGVLITDPSGVPSIGTLTLSYLPSNVISYSLSGIANTIAMFTAPATIANSIITQSANGISIADSLGIGVVAQPSVGFYIHSSLALSGSTTQYGVFSNPTGGSGATSLIAGGFFASNSPGASITIANMYGLLIGSPTINAGDTVSTASGISIQAITGATTNYAIQTAGGLHRFRDPIWLGTVSSSTAMLYVSAPTTALVGTTILGVHSDITFPSTATAGIEGFRSRVTTAATAYNVTTVAAFRAQNPVLGAGSSITTAYGLLIDSITSGSSNFAIHTGTGPVFFGDTTTISTSNLIDFILAGSPSNIQQMQLGDSGGYSTLGTRFSNGGLVLAQNAYQNTLATDSWAANSAAVASWAIEMHASGSLGIFAATAGTAPGNFATFWGTALLSIGATGAITTAGSAPSFKIGTPPLVSFGGGTYGTAGSIGQVGVTSGESNLALYVNDGTHNRRVKFFMDDTNSVWGFKGTYANAGIGDFVMSVAGTEFLRLTTSSGILTLPLSSSQLIVNTDPGGSAIVRIARDDTNGSLAAGGIVGLHASISTDTLVNVGAGGSHPSSATTIYGTKVSYSVPTTATSKAIGYYARMVTPAGSTTYAQLSAFLLDTPSFGAGNTLTLSQGITVANQGNSTVGTSVGLDISAQSGSTTNYAIRTSTGLVSLGDDLIINTLGRFNSAASAPLADQVMSFSGGTSKWNPRTLQFSFTTGAVTAAALADGTTVALVNAGGSGGTQGGTPSAPTTQAVYNAIVVTLPTALPSNCVYVIDYSVNGGSYTTNAIICTSNQVVHSGLLPANTYAYKYLIRGAGDTAYSTASSALNPSNKSEVNAFGLIVASQIAVTNLAAISASLGVIRTGLILNTNSTAAIRLDTGTISPVPQDQGTATAGAASTLTDSSKSWTTNIWTGYQIRIVAGTGAGQTRTVASNTSTVITVSSSWGTNPDTTSQYQIGWQRWLDLGSTTDSDYLLFVSSNSSNIPALSLTVGGLLSVSGIITASTLLVNNSATLLGSMRVEGGIIQRTVEIAATGLSYGTTGIERLMMSSAGYSLYTSGDVLAGLLGNYSIQVGGGISSFTDTVNISAGTTSIGTPGVLTYSSFATSSAPSQLAVDGNYTLTGVVNITVTTINAIAYTGSTVTTYISYSTNAGSTWSSEVQLTLMDAIDSVGASYSPTFSYTINTAAAKANIRFRVRYAVIINATKVFTGSIAIASGSQLSTIYGSYLSSGSSFNRRSLYLGAATNMPQIYLTPIVTTAPTNANTTEGELWYNGLTHRIEYNLNGTIRSVANTSELPGNTSTGSHGLIQLGGDIGGTDTAQTVLGLHFGSTGITLSSTAPTSGQEIVYDGTNISGRDPTAMGRYETQKSWFRAGQSGSAGLYGLGSGTPSQTAGAGAMDAKGTYVQVTTASGAGNHGGVWSNAANMIELQMNPTMWIYVKTGANQASNRLWFGYSTNTQTSQTNTPSNTPFVGITVNGTTDFRFVYSDGTTGTSAAYASRTPAINTYYLIKLRIAWQVASANTLFVSINGDAEQSIAFTSASLITASTTFGWAAWAVSTGAVTGTMQWYWTQCEYGS